MTEAERIEASRKARERRLLKGLHELLDGFRADVDIHLADVEDQDKRTVLFGGVVCRARAEMCARNAKVLEQLLAAYEAK